MELKTTKRPSALIPGPKLAPEPGNPPGVTLISSTEPAAAAICNGANCTLSARQTANERIRRVARTGHLATPDARRLRTATRSRH